MGSFCDPFSCHLCQKEDTTGGRSIVQVTGDVHLHKRRLKCVGVTVKQALFERMAHVASTREPLLEKHWQPALKIAHSAAPQP
jgi:hypothetical protein